MRSPERVNVSSEMPAGVLDADRLGRSTTSLGSVHGRGKQVGVTPRSTAHPWGGAFLSHRSMKLHASPPRWTLSADPEHTSIGWSLSPLKADNCDRVAGSPGEKVVPSPSDATKARERVSPDLFVVPVQPQQVSHELLLDCRVAERQRWIDLVTILPTRLLASHVSRSLEVGEDAIRGAFGDLRCPGELGDGCLRIARHCQEHLGVFSDERPRPKCGQVDWDSLALHLPQPDRAEARFTPSFRYSSLPRGPVLSSPVARLGRPARRDGC
jgi:hypothetical protein